MPIPSVKLNEDKEDFISRCMSSEKMKEEFPKEKIRLGVCFSQYEKAKKRSTGTKISWDTFENDSILFLI